MSKSVDSQAAVAPCDATVPETESALCLGYTEHSHPSVGEWSVFCSGVELVPGQMGKETQADTRASGLYES